MYLYGKFFFLIFVLFFDFILCDSLQNDTKVLVKRESSSNAFDGVYTECFLYLSYTCLQRKTLVYLKELDGVSEVPIVGDYLKFVKTNHSIVEEENEIQLDINEMNAEDLSHRIDEAVDKFFKTHAMKISAMGREVLMPSTVEEFVGRKRKGGGGGGGGGGHHGGDDGGKKKMMMMAMMCMKMKMMVMVPAMMGMMGMMSFKGMMFSMMSFMISKMMLLMKLLEKKNSFSGSGGDPGWATGGGGGGGGGAWMPAGPEYGGAGYDSNAQWQRRSILSKSQENLATANPEKPIITYIKPNMRYNNNNKPYYSINSESKHEDNKTKSRKKRGIVDALQNAYLYWLNKMLGFYQPNLASNKKSSFQRYKVVNGVKYVYYPSKLVRSKTPKELQYPQAETTEFLKPIVAVGEYSKGEIQDEPESRMIRKKIHNMVSSVNDTMDQDPWQ